MKIIVRGNCRDSSKFSTKRTSRDHIDPGVLPEKLDGDVHSAFKNPYPIYDQNLRFSPPYLWPNQNFILYSRPDP